MRTKRQVVDYSMRRRALLREVYAGRVSTYEVCDASSYLLAAARYHGEPTDERCPVCRRENLTHVHYVYGDELKHSAGQARSRVELPALAMSVREMQVYLVEVCRGCGWNHLVEQFLAGRSALEPVRLDLVNHSPVPRPTPPRAAVPRAVGSRSAVSARSLAGRETAPRQTAPRETAQ